MKNRVTRVASAAALAVGAFLIPVAANATGTSAVVSLDNPVVGWNNATSANNDYRLGLMLNLITPGPYYLDQAGKLVLNKNYVSSATSAVKSGKQVVTYVINPKAVWSDNVAINADDFIYIWQALSCNEAYTDKGGAPYDAAGCSGYDQIESVKGSLPKSAAGAALACDAGSSANRNAGLCPNGKTVTVTFKAGQSYPEWQGLFGLLPAHKIRVTGFNTGYDDDGDALTNVLSGGPYKLSSFNRDNNNYTFVKNPRWWGTAGKLDTIVFKDLGSDDNGVAGLEAGDYNVFEPTAITATIKAQADAADVSQQIKKGYQFEHLDFNMGTGADYNVGPGNTAVKNIKVRQAIAYAINRDALINATAGAIYNTDVLDNRIFMIGQAGYKANGKAYDIGGTATGRAKAKTLLTSAGYKYNTNDDYFHIGTTTGTKLTLKLVMNGTTARQAEAQLVQSMLRAVGISVQIATASNGLSLSHSVSYDMVIFAWVGSPFLSGNKDIYACDGGSNFGGYCNTKVDAKMIAANKSLTMAAEAKLYGEADALMWADMPTLPLYQKANFAAWKGLTGVVVNPTSAGITWNADKWATS